MGFTTACFIRKNTKELRDKLIKFGYCVVGKSLQCIKTNVQGKLYIAEQAFEFELNGRIDCGTNEELFLSIAALRDDSDIHQWFTDGYHWEKCPESVADIETWRMYYKTIPHKATVEELIEYFK